MSLSKLRKLPTDWLDYNDRRAAERIASSEASDRQLSAGSSPANDWEVIGISSGDMSPPLPRERSQISRSLSRTGSKRKYPTSTVASLMEDEERSVQGGGFVVKLCGVSHRVFESIGFSELGTGRLVGIRLLVVSRLLFLFMLGVSAGFSYSLRDKISVKFLLSELFIWLHLALLFVMPLLLISSILTLRWNYLRDPEDEEGPSKQGQGTWLTVEVLYQVVTVLAQTELFRLLVMHSVPSLRPIVSHEDVALLFSLTNPFAAQRYLAVAITIVDSLLSTVPLRAENCIPTLLVYIPWASVSLFSRPTQSPTSVKIGYLFGFTVLVIVLTFLNVLVHRALSSRTDRRRELSDGRPKTTVDVV